MSAAAFFNGVERMFAPADVVARQRDQLLNMQGKYDAPTPAAPATPAHSLSPSPDAAMAAHVTQGTARIGPTGVIGPGDETASGDMSVWEEMEVREARERQEELNWDIWAERNNIDKIPSREIGLPAKWQQVSKGLLEQPEWRDPRYAALPSNWSQERKDKAIQYMRNQEVGRKLGLYPYKD